MLATTIAIQLSEGKSADEIFMLRNIASQISSTLYTLYTQKQYLAKNCDPCAKKSGEERTKPPAGSKTIPGN